jgi:hypothetical protein
MSNTSKSVARQFAGRAVTLARRSQGVTRSKLCGMNAKIGWRTYLVREALTSERVWAKKVDGETTYFVA